MSKWYDDRDLVRELPLRYRVYALYSRLLGAKDSRRVPGGSFLLRVIRKASSMFRASTIARVRGINGLLVVTDFADERVLDVIHEIRGENAEYIVMKALLTEGSTFVDVGANFGTFSLLASQLVGKNGRVIAIEPQLRLVQFIRESIGLSGITNCVVLQSAVSREKGTREFFIPAGDSGRAGFFKSFSGQHQHESTRVPVDTLASLVGDISGSIVVKIDVEGSEMRVLDGANEFIREHRPKIIIEINPSSAAASGVSPVEIVNRLAMLGYDSFSTAESFPAAVPRDSLPLTRQFNLVSRHSGP